MSIFCKHEWILISEVETKSKFQHSIDLISKLVIKIDLPHQLCDANRKHIQVFTCEKCGKIKRYVENI